MLAPAATFALKSRSKAGSMGREGLHDASRGPELHNTILYFMNIRMPSLVSQTAIHCGVIGTDS